MNNGGRSRAWHRGYSANIQIAFFSILYPTLPYFLLNWPLELVVCSLPKARRS